MTLETVPYESANRNGILSASGLNRNKKNNECDSWCAP